MGTCTSVPSWMVKSVVEADVFCTSSWYLCAAWSNSEINSWHVFSYSHRPKVESCKEINYNNYQIWVRVNGLPKIITKVKKKSISVLSMHEIHVAKFSQSVTRRSKGQCVTLAYMGCWVHCWALPNICQYTFIHMGDKPGCPRVKYLNQNTIQWDWPVLKPGLLDKE